MPVNVERANASQRLRKPRDDRAPDPRPDRRRKEFISRQLRLTPLAGPAGISLYLAHSGSGLGRLLAREAEDAGAPYWAYCWAGGMALARHFAARPETVAGKRVLDLGAGGGIVAIAAAKAGAEATSLPPRSIRTDVPPFP